MSYSPWGMIHHAQRFIRTKTEYDEVRRAYQVCRNFRRECKGCRDSVFAAQRSREIRREWFRGRW